MSEIKPESHITKEECQEMIDAAIRRHNRNASVISMCVGWVVLALFAEGMLRLVGVIDPIFPWLKITL
jgi:predicted nucleic acid-binding Zn ribbon protein